MRSYAHLPTRLCWDRFSSLEFLAQLDEAARNPAGDRAGGQFERLADRPVGLVTGKKAVEDLSAVLGEARHRVVDVERLVDSPDGVLVGVNSQLGLVGRLLPRARSQTVDADAPGQLGDPGLNRLVAAQRVESLVDLGENLLEDVLGVMFAESEPLRRDRIDVARETLHERRPRLLIAVAATGDELRGRNRLCQAALLDRDLLLLRFAEPLGHHLKELPGDLGVRLDERPELPGGEPVAGEVGIGGNSRGAARLVVDQRDLAEVVAGAELASLLAVDVHARASVADDEEADAACAIRRNDVTGAETALLERAGDSLQLAVREALKERDLLEQLGRRVGHGPILCGKAARH